MGRNLEVRNPKPGSERFFSITAGWGNSIQPADSHFPGLIIPALWGSEKWRNWPGRTPRQWVWSQVPTQPPPKIISSNLGCWALRLRLNSPHYLSPYPARTPALSLCHRNQQQELGFCSPSSHLSTTWAHHAPCLLQMPWSSSAVPLAGLWNCYILVSLSILPARGQSLCGTCLCVPHGTCHKASLRINEFPPDAMKILMRISFYVITRKCLSILKWNGLWNSRLSGKPRSYEWLGNRSCLIQGWTVRSKALHLGSMTSMDFSRCNNPLKCM